MAGFASGCFVGMLSLLLAQHFGSGKFLMWTPLGGVRLGDTTYQARKITSPAASGLLLRILAVILGSRSILAQNMRRMLLNDNKLNLLRALALQIIQAGRTIALHCPMVRLDAKALVAHERMAAEAEPAKNRKGPYNSVLDYHAAFKSGESSPSKVLDKLLAAVDVLPPELRVFTEMVSRDVLRKEAQASAERYAKGKFLSVFDGVPVAFKDMVWIAGLNCTRGTHPSYGTGTEMQDDVTVARLREVGAVVLGFTVMTEYGSTPLGYSVHAQAPVNAYDASRYSGGSSSGSGVGAALGLFPVALGFDGGGSIRIPSAMSGIVGLKCTWGRVAVDDDFCATNVSAGPMAGSAADAALFYEVIGKPVTDHFYQKMYGPTSLPPAHSFGFNRVDDLSDLRLGVFQPWFDDCHPEVRDRTSEALKFLQQKGAKVVPVELPNLEVLATAHGVNISVQFTTAHDHQIFKSPETLEPATHIQFALGASMTATEYDSTMWIRGWATDYISELFREKELSGIFTPTLSTLPPSMPPAAKATGESNTTLICALLQYIFLGNFCGLPAIAIPAGLSQDGLPLSVQLIGKHWDEHICLRVANAMDVPHFRSVPKHFVNLLQED
mmetsp:Transcript_36500/g.96191  ORF Transcript_36500/g.96191 Transcript_36500/m.96191 type:complete len:611 (+) Transcript_36500:103-1935(+)